MFINHHETFTMGGRLFTGDVRKGEDPNSELILRRRIPQNGSDVATL